MKSWSRSINGVSGFYLAAICLAAVLPVAGGPFLTQPGIALFAALGVFAIGLASVRSSTRFSVKVVAAIPFILAAAGYAQMVPLPIEWLASISPHTAELYVGLLDDVESAPISRAPVETHFAALHQLAFATVLLAGLYQGRQSHKVFLKCLMAMGCLVSIIGFIHQWAALKALYGFYETTDFVGPGFRGPFVNANHSASFITLASGAALGLSLSGERRTRKIAIMALALFAVSIIASKSRAGLVVFCVSVFAFGFALFAQKVGQEANPKALTRLRAVSFGFTAILALLSGIFLSDEWSSHNLRNYLKFEVWQASLPLVQDHVAVGIGRGAFEATFTTYQAENLGYTITHPENIVIQLLSEWGAVGTLGLGAGIAGWFIAMSEAVKSQDQGRLGLLCGLLGVGVHQLIDFGFELYGLSIPVAATFGLALSGSGRTKRQDGSIPGTVITAAASLFCLAIFCWLQAVPRIPTKALAEIRTARMKTDEFQQRILDLASAHPSNYLVSLNAAARLSEGGADNLPYALKWVNRTLTLNPSEGRGHLIAARSLLKAGHKEQSALEYRLALANSALEGPVLKNEIFNVFQAPELLARTMPLDGNHWSTLLWELKRNGRQQDAQLYLERLIERAPEHEEIQFSFGELCATSASLKCFETSLQWFFERNKDTSMSALHAIKMARQGKRQDALALLETKILTAHRIQDHVMRAATKVATQLNALTMGRRLFDRWWKQPAVNVGQLLAYRAEMESEIGDLDRAITGFERASDFYFREHKFASIGYLLRAARLEMDNQRMQSAKRRLLNAQKRYPPAQSYQASIQKGLDRLKRGTHTIDTQD